MKKRTIALMLSVLAVMMLVGVGFATWVISQGAAQEQTGSLVVETVKDNRLAVTVTAKNSGLYKETAHPENVINAAAYAALDEQEKAAYEEINDANKLNFTAPLVANQANKWLTAEDGHAVEKRTMVLEVSISKLDGSVFTSSTLPTVVLELSEDQITKAGLVELNTTGFTSENSVYSKTIDSSELTISQDAKSVTCTLIVEFVWGNVFDGENPYDFFNAKTVDGAISAQDVTDAADAGLTYGNPAAALTATSVYGDLAHAALEALLTQQAKTIKAKVSVTL